LYKKWFYPVLIGSTILSTLAHFFIHYQSFQFATACLSLLSWAVLLGKATETVAYYAGQRLGGLLNATFGNAAELIIAIFLIKEGLFNMVKASITGSVIGNLLLVLGLSIFLGGLKYKMQKFNPMLAGHNTSLMMLSVIALFVPAIFLRGLDSNSILYVSIIIAFVLLIGYFLWLHFSLVTHKEELGEAIDGAPNRLQDGDEAPTWSKSTSLWLLFGSTVWIAIQSEWLVHHVKAVATTLGWSQLFIGAFLIAIIGNAAEHTAAIFLARKGHIGTAVEIAIGSSLQVALFVAPMLVFISLLFGNPMNIIFSNYEITAIAVSTFITASISHDGSTNWYEGVLLLAVYVILGTVFFVLP
jgi:Ca2+:H+ antiporter